MHSAHPPLSRAGVVHKMAPWLCHRLLASGNRTRGSVARWGHEGQCRDCSRGADPHSSDLRAIRDRGLPAQRFELGDLGRRQARGPLRFAGRRSAAGPARCGRPSWDPESRPVASGRLKGGGGRIWAHRGEGSGFEGRGPALGSGARTTAVGDSPIPSFFEFGRGQDLRCETTVAQFACRTIAVFGPRSKDGDDESEHEGHVTTCFGSWSCRFLGQGRNERRGRATVRAIPECV